MILGADGEPSTEWEDLRPARRRLPQSAVDDDSSGETEVPIGKRKSVLNSTRRYNQFLASLASHASPAGSTDPDRRSQPPWTSDGGISQDSGEDSTPVEMEPACKRSSVQREPCPGAGGKRAKTPPLVQELRFRASIRELGKLLTSRSPARRFDCPWLGSGQAEALWLPPQVRRSIDARGKHVNDGNSREEEAME